MSIAVGKMAVNVYAATLRRPLSYDVRISLSFSFFVLLISETL